MPHLIIRGVPVDQIRVISPSLVTELAAICDCPADHVLLECLSTTAVFDGKIISSYPFVEVNWFDRGEKARDQAAECIDRHVRSLGISDAEVAFRIYEADSYYANGARLSLAREEGVLQALQEENKRLKEELQKARKALQSSQASSASYMSSKLYDALRE